jgi:hypothetical protein
VWAATQQPGLTHLAQPSSRHIDRVPVLVLPLSRDGIEELLVPVYGDRPVVDPELGERGRIDGV